MHLLERPSIQWQQRTCLQLCYCSWVQVPQVITAGAAVVAADTEDVLTEDGQSSESVMTALHSGSSHDNDDGSDISLKLS